MAEDRGGSRWTEEDSQAIENVLQIAHVLTRRILRSDGIPDAAWHSRCRLQDALRDAQAARAKLAVFPVGEPDDERLVETVEKALREAVIVEGPEGERAMDFSLDRLARAAVAAVRAAEEENPE